MVKHVLSKLLVSSAIVVCLWSTSSAATSVHTILIISIDALHPLALSKETSPNIYNIMQTGTYTLNGHSTDPPKTLISHTAMFTGLTPEKSGKVDNQWNPGEPAIDRKTIFNSAREHGFRTGYFYSKDKLGYLVNNAVDVHRLSRDDTIDFTDTFIREGASSFVFLHVSGLDYTGVEYGWLSTEYMEELYYIDLYLETLFKTLRDRTNYLLVITSDHAGHGKVHGSRHPDDYRLPFIIYSDVMQFKEVENSQYAVTDWTVSYRPDNLTVYFNTLYFLRLFLMYGQCKTRWMAMMIINPKATHSWTSRKKCLMEIKERSLVSYPLGNSSQFIRPVILSKIKSTNEATLTTQSLTAFLFGINFLQVSFRFSCP
ncbi:MAG: alkaline phosphatase family protein [Deltaproteobacteria bacterium]|nr:alkaline phosphatase family protein [Deltaproteobacteria bacterium]